MPDDPSSAEFSKFLRFFTTRVIQSVVQARLGKPVEQICSAQPDSCDWFNTKVDELGEIAAYIRQTIAKYPPAVQSLTLEFLLYTSDGQYLPLEAWQLHVDGDSDNTVNIRSDLYHQLGTLLRSIIAAARITPMYRYFVRKQGCDSFVILYRIYEGVPCADLGTESKTVHIAQLPSPHGTICVDLTFRTRMELPQKQEAPEEPPASPASPPHLIFSSSSPRPQKLRVSARPSFSDAVPVSGGDTEQLSPMSDQVFGTYSSSPVHSECAGSPAPRSHFRLGRSSSSEDSTILSDTLVGSGRGNLPSPATSATSPVPIRMRNHSKDSKDSHTDRSSRSSLFGSRLRNNSFPFASLLTQSQIGTTTVSKRNSVCLTPNETVIEEKSDYREGTVERSDEEKEKEEKKEENEEKEEEKSIDQPEDNNDKTKETMESSDESFVKVFAFGSRETLGNDLGQLIKEFRLAPPGLQESTAEDSAGLREQIERFSSIASSFDDFVKTVNQQAD